MVAKDGRGPVQAEEEEFSLFQAISEELTHVPVQKEPLHKDAVTPDMEGMESLNSLPDVTLSGSLDNKWADEDGVIRSGKYYKKKLLSPFTVPRLFRF